MKLGADTWLWAATFGKEHLFCIEEAARMGCEVIDFSINDPRVFPVQEAAKRVEDCGMVAVTSTALPLACNPISPDREVRGKALEFMERLVDITALLGAHVTGGVNHSASGYHSGKVRSAQEVEWCAQYLEKLTAYAGQRGVTIAMEPVKRFESHFMNTAAQALEMIDLVKAQNLGVHLDTFHMNIEEASFTEAILSCGPHLKHMHLVDSNRGAPGQGHIDWVEIMRALKAIGYEGTACIETFNPNTLDETCMMTYLTRQFAKTPGELVERGMKTLKAAMVLAGME